MHKPLPLLVSLSTLVEYAENSGTQVNETSFYKMEMIEIQLFSAHGHPTVVDVENRMNAQTVCKDSLEFVLRFVWDLKFEHSRVVL